MEETYDLISDLEVDISTLEKKVDTVNVEIDNTVYSCESDKK